jgi:hypothetical protein
MRESNLEGCGGLICAEHSTGVVAASVAAAEEVTSLGRFENVALSRQALMRIGGLEAVATCDDISSRICSAGVRIGRSPAAVMWKPRPHTLRGFLARQGRCGSAEIPRLPTERRPYAIATGARSLSWMIFWIAVALASRLTGINVVPALAMLLVGPILAIWNFWDAPLERRHRGSAARVLVGVLAYVGSLWRDMMHCRTFLRQQFGSRGAIAKSDRFHHRVALR